MRSEILWVGVGFNPDADGDDFEEQHGVIVDICCYIELEHKTVTSAFPGGESIDTQVVPELGSVIDVFDSFGSRVGFGIRVESSIEGTERRDHAKEWLEREGIVLPVGFYAWTPAQDSCPRKQ